MTSIFFPTLALAAHYESISRGAEDTSEKILRFQKEVRFMKNKWGSALQYDPFYNQNLTKDREDLSITNTYYKI